MTPTQARFTLRPITLLAFAFPVLVVVWEFATGPGTVPAATSAAGRLIAILLAPLLVGAIAFRVSRRSNRAGNAAVGVVLLLLGATFLRTAVRRYGNAAAGDAGLRDVQALNRRATDAIREGDQEAALDATDAAVQRLRKAAADSSGSQKTILAFTADTVRRRADLSRAYLAAVSAFREPGGARAAGLDADAGALRQRIDLLARARKAHDALSSELDDFPAHARSALAAGGVPAAEIDGYLAGIRGNPEFDRTRKVQNMEHDILDLAGRRLAIMLTTHGRWTADDSGELNPGPGFPPADLEELSRIDASIDRINQAQQNLLHKSTPR